MLTNDTPTCTCPEHAENPRPINAYGVEYVHSSDDTYAWTIHVHYYRWSKDCDGAMSTDSVLLPVPTDSYPDHERLWAHAVMMDRVPSPEEGFTYRVTVEYDNVRANGPTEEGGFEIDMTVCQHPDCANTFERRDYQAEAAGY